MTAAGTIVPPQGASEAPAELTRLYEAHNAALFAHCLRDLRRREDAEDAVQRTFLYALMSLRRGVVPEFEQAWLLKIASNVCSSTRRAAARRRQVETPQDLVADRDLAHAPHYSPAVLDARELRTALETLPGAQRRAIVLREWQGLSYNEIGDRLGLTKPATEMLLFRARRTLARRLREQRAAVALNGASLLSWLRSLAGANVAKTTAVTAAAALSTGTVPFVAPKLEAVLQHASGTRQAAPAPIAEPRAPRGVIRRESPIRVRRAAPAAPGARGRQRAGRPAVGPPEAHVRAPARDTAADPPARQASPPRGEHEAGPAPAASKPTSTGAALAPVASVAPTDVSLAAQVDAPTVRALRIAEVDVRSVAAALPVDVPAVPAAPTVPLPTP
ncbi:MAG TPA: sigma-70 family RNA polymerase sigma factor [Gaiellaceae bacterium]|nr:sigma-70 family RNA polymerase sigma factor [Gaiellaceae bacterium]